MSNTTYNGWTNYATWRVNLEIFDGMTVRDVTGRSIVPVSDLRDYLQKYAEEMIETTSSEGLARDYALAFLSEVNWWEIANAMLADEEAEEDEEESEEA
jgi:hypothetical protein